MSQETQTTETAQTADQTVQAVAQATQAEAAPALTGDVFTDGKNAAVAMVEAMRAEKAKAGASAATTQTAEADQETQRAAGQEATEGKEGQAADKTEAATAEPADEEAAKAAKALADAARENRAIIAERKRLAERERLLRDKETQLQTASVPERETMARIAKARESNDPIELLRVAGYTDPRQITQFVLDAIERMGPADEEQKQEIKRSPTAEEVAALVTKQAEEKARVERERVEAERTQNMARQRDEYFTNLHREVKSNAKNYPLVMAVGPTHAELEAEFVRHYQKTGERLDPPALLGMLEKKFSGRGLTVAPKKTPATTAPVTARTVGARATSDAGAVTVKEAEHDPKKSRSMDEVYEEGKRKALAAISAKRAAKAR